jgi:hypothetical protein
MDQHFLRIVEENDQNRILNNDENDADIKLIYQIFSPCKIYEAGQISLKDFLTQLEQQNITLKF